MGKDITKKCKACEINFDKLKKRKNKNQEFQFPKDVPVSEKMRNSINLLRGNK